MRYLLHRGSARLSRAVPFDFRFFYCSVAFRDIYTCIFFVRFDFTVAGVIEVSVMLRWRW